MGPPPEGESPARDDGATLSRAQGRCDVPSVPAQVGVPLRVRGRRVCEGLHHLSHADVCESGESIALFSSGDRALISAPALSRAM